MPVELNEDDDERVERMVQAIHFTLLDLYRMERTPDLQFAIDRLEQALGYSPAGVE